TMGALSSGTMDKIGGGANLFGIMEMGLNIPFAKNILFLIMMTHAGLTAVSIKVADGGNKYACLIDFVVMTWLVALVALVLPYMFGSIFGAGGEPVREIGTVGP
ncbi:hypothetical protein ACFLRC_04080, partial [Candidatus Altiarchaeota archaeon]